MGFFTKFDIHSEFTQFFLTIAVLALITTVLLARITKGGRGSRSGSNPKFDDQIIDRNREIID